MLNKHDKIQAVCKRTSCDDETSNFKLYKLDDPKINATKVGPGNVSLHYVSVHMALINFKGHKLDTYVNSYYIQKFIFKMMKEIFLIKEKEIYIKITTIY